MQQSILYILEKININRWIPRLCWLLAVCPRTTWLCCWRSTTERGYTWSPMRWRGAWTTRSPCRTSTTAWSRSTWSTGWRRASLAASPPSRLVLGAVFLLVPTLTCLLCDLLLASVSSRRRRASPSASQTWRLWPRAPRLRPQPEAPRGPNWLFLDATLFIFLYRINYFLLKGCLCVYSIYTSADGEIKAPLIHPELRMCVFVASKPYLFLALVSFELLLAAARHWIYSINSWLFKLDYVSAISEAIETLIWRRYEEVRPFYTFGLITSHSCRLAPHESTLILKWWARPPHPIAGLWSLSLLRGSPDSLVEDGERQQVYFFFSTGLDGKSGNKGIMLLWQSWQHGILSYSGNVPTSRIFTTFTKTCNERQNGCVLNTVFVASNRYKIWGLWHEM